MTGGHFPGRKRYYEALGGPCIELDEFPLPTELPWYPFSRLQCSAERRKTSSEQKTLKSTVYTT